MCRSSPFPWTRWMAQAPLCCGFAVPGGVQKTCRYGASGHGLADMVVMGRCFEVFSNLTDSMILSSCWHRRQQPTLLAVGSCVVLPVLVTTGPDCTPPSPLPVPGGRCYGQFRCKVVALHLSHGVAASAVPAWPELGAPWDSVGTTAPPATPSPVWGTPGVAVARPQGRLAGA